MVSESCFYYSLKARSYFVITKATILRLICKVIVFKVKNCTINVQLFRYFKLH